MNSKAKLCMFLIAASPALMGAKCVDYDERFGGSVGVTSEPSVPAATSDAAPAGPAAFVPGKACETANLAMIKIENRKFDIQCGCEETTGKVCTIPTGTTVRWQFADSDDHNVAPNASMLVFPASGEMSSGLFTYTFAAAGTYKYGCSIHTDMRGYSIVAK